MGFSSAFYRADCVPDCGYLSVASIRGQLFKEQTHYGIQLFLFVKQQGKIQFVRNIKMILYYKC